MSVFSILIANYNNGRFLQEAIESVSSQSFKDWEIIIVDDGSTDDSSIVYEQFKDNPKIHIYFNGQNRGCAYSKHQCVLHANSDFCGFLDPDDVLLPNAIEITIRALQESSDTVLTFSRHYICDKELNVINESRLLELKDGESYFEHHDYRAEVFAGFRKDAYLKSGGLDVYNRAGVDADLYFRLEEQGRIAIIDEFTYKYRRHSHAITASIDKMMYWNLMIRHNTCLRRGLPVEEYSLKDFKDYIRMRTDLEISQNEQALLSKAYKLGKTLLKPFSAFKHRTHGI